MESRTHFSHLTEDQLRQMAAQLITQLGEQQAQHAAELSQRDKTLQHYKIRNEQLTHELALLKRHRFGQRSEAGSPQYRLLDDIVEEDLAAVESELAQLVNTPAPTRTPRKPARQSLPPELPRTDVHHDPESTACACGCQLTCIGEDISEKLDYEPGQFSVERHIRSTWACKQCEAIVQAPVAPHVIDKGIPTTNLLAHVLISKYADHLPLYRQQQIYARAGVELPRSTLADWVGRCGMELTPLVDALRSELLAQDILHADETPVAMPDPGQKKTRRAYVWAYATPRTLPVQGVVYDFQPTRSGQVSREFLAGWQGSLICDDYAGYKAGFAQGIREVGCWAHARRKFHELLERNQSPIAERALATIGALYEIECATTDGPPEHRRQVREDEARPIITAFHAWLTGQRSRLTSGTSTAKAIDYSLNRWEALVRYLDDGRIPIDNNWVENQIRPWALGRKNWLFAGSVRSGQRAANVMTLIQSAKINGLDPQAYLKDVLERMSTVRQSDLAALLPHSWAPSIKV